MKLSSKDDTADIGQSVYLVPAVDRALRILQLIREKGRDLSAAEIAEETGLNPSTVHKLAVTLLYHGVLERDKTTKKYSLGFALLAFGHAVFKTLDIRQTAKPFMKELVDYAEETALLSILRGTKVIIVDVEESKSEHRIVPNTGAMTPATTSSNGKAMLAWLPEKEAAKIMQAEGLPKLSNKSITSLDAYRADLAAIRTRGYATDLEEFRPGLCAVSAPLFNSNRQVIGALSLVGPAYRLKEKEILRYGKRCAEVAGRLSKRLS